MKHFSTLATVAILSIAFSANVDARRGNNPPEKPDFSMIDTDGDGEISEQELSDHKPPRRER
ncbi:calcium-binding EF-hand domain-containing protein [Pseudoalteromonas sp. BSi20652]|uniref:EF-hand domain-containing protein n=1 Tax=Pseudoalteromonas sp. BSi20652 TaxID=388384 RepID=UPI0002317621|nr:EF-hand domain-containing protein [Pseudoalteromonas sp. BSi20652]GAA60452.1 calcium-binding EF-hand domain-containing protein [Pseudoalteromonas sp. BSi20652]